MNIVLPDSRFGLTATNYNVQNLPNDLPKRGAMVAANTLNAHLYENLTHKQRLFVAEYLHTKMDAAKAAELAGFYTNDPTLSDAENAAGARRAGSRLLKKPYIERAIQLAFAYHAENSKINVNELLQELKIIALTSAGEFFKNDGDGDPYLVMPDDGDPRLRAVSEITVDSYVEGKGPQAREVKRIKFKMHDKRGAINDLLKIAAATKSTEISEDNVADSDKSQEQGDAASVQIINIAVVPRGEFVTAPKQVETVQQALPQGTPALSAPVVRESTEVVDPARSWDSAKKLVEGITKESVFGGGAKVIDHE